MRIDHIFIFSNNKGQEADELVQFGLTEGSNQIHQGQGTRNRKFYFENFFLEIVWVYNLEEIRSASTAPTKLWERADHQNNGYSPFGLCLIDAPDTEELFEGCLKYKPDYVPPGMSFDIITNENYPFLPWACRLPSTARYTANEPRDHPVGVKRLTGIQVGIQKKDFQSRFTQLITSASNIIFYPADNHCLTLEFDNKTQKSTRKFVDLPLVIEY
jgi:hypothetical protein